MRRDGGAGGTGPDRRRGRGVRVRVGRGRPGHSRAGGGAGRLAAAGACLGPAPCGRAHRAGDRRRHQRPAAGPPGRRLDRGSAQRPGRAGPRLPQWAEHDAGGSPADRVAGQRDGGAAGAGGDASHDRRFAGGPLRAGRRPVSREPVRGPADRPADGADGSLVLRPGAVRPPVRVDIGDHGGPGETARTGARCRLQLARGEPVRARLSQRHRPEQRAGLARIPGQRRAASGYPRRPPKSGPAAGASLAGPAGGRAGQRAVTSLLPGPCDPPVAPIRRPASTGRRHR
jgi:hypothetical protein